MPIKQPRNFIVAGKSAIVIVKGYLQANDIFMKRPREFIYHHSLFLSRKKKKKQRYAFSFPG